jgi:glycosyltransferase involved in cell wall biosynthesis
MKLALIAHGAMSIPPKGWGAVEGTIWNRKIYLERVGHSVDIFNTRHIHSVLYQINCGNYDFAHCHNEMFVLDCVAHLRIPFAVTSHTAVSRLSSGDYKYGGATHYLFKDTLHAPTNIVLSDGIKCIYERAGYRHFLRVLRNAVETERFTLAARSNAKAICVGRITGRKKQSWLSEIARDRISVDFVGPWDRTREPAFEENGTSKYLGAWDRQTLYEHLTDYSCLVLLSEAEGAPKVVLEAFAAGLSVVISEACSANLTQEEFITVIPDNETRPEVIANAIQESIDKNATLRPEIRRYAWKRFDYSVVCQDYLRIIDEARAFQSARPHQRSKTLKKRRSRPAKLLRDLSKRARRLIKKLRRLAKKLHLPRRRGGRPSLSSSVRHGYRRPERTMLTERLAELWVANRYGWDLDILRGKLPVNLTGRSGAYRFLSPRPLLLQLRPRIDVLRVSRWLRFGNSVTQLINAFTVAERLGARILQFPQPHPFLVGEQAGDFQVVCGDATDSATCLEGEFFHLNAFQFKPPASEVVHIVKDLLRPLLKPEVRSQDPRVNSDDLVLHFRAGDIFRQSKPPHQSYGQPPASYYLAAVDREKPSRVWLVFEDRSNPCIDAVGAALRSRGLEVLEQSGALKEDLRVLLTASRLVAGRGSFAHMVAHLSERLCKAYFFEKREMTPLRELGVEIVLAEDADGEFNTNLLKNNWTGSAEQRALMLSYPADKLEFHRVN